MKDYMSILYISLSCSPLLPLLPLPHLLSFSPISSPLLSSPISLPLLFLSPSFLSSLFPLSLTVSSLILIAMSVSAMHVECVEDSQELLNRLRVAGSFFQSVTAEL